MSDAMPVIERPEQTERPERKPTWQCEFCGRFYSERTAKNHAYCIQAYDRECAEKMWPHAR